MRNLCPTLDQLGLSKNPPQGFGRGKNTGLSMKSFTNPGTLPFLVLLPFFLGSLPPCSSVTIFPSEYRIPCYCPDCRTLHSWLLVILVPNLEKHQLKTAMIRTLLLVSLTMGATSYPDNFSAFNTFENLLKPRQRRLTVLVTDFVSSIYNLKAYFEQPAASPSLLLIFIEYKIQEIPRF